MAPHDFEVIKELSDLYPTHSEATRIWKQAGGAGPVDDQASPRARWNQVFHRAREGARATPVALVCAALDEYPRNQALYRWCMDEVPPELRARIRASFQVLRDHPDASADLVLNELRLGDLPDVSEHLIELATITEASGESKETLTTFGRLLNSVKAGTPGYALKIVEAVSRGAAAAALDAARRA